MSGSERHFERIRELKAFERRLLDLIVSRDGLLSRPHEALFRYALALAQLDRFETPAGEDVSLADELQELRRWMADSLVALIPEDGEPDVATLRDLVPVLALRVDRARRQVLENHSDKFGAEHLDAELRQKDLVLVLGGGGGAGLFHLGTFALFDEIGITPEFIVGSSMGSIMGLVRALDREYDPFETALALPRELDREAVFRPFTGYSRFGFPGAFHLNLLRVARRIFENLVGSPDVRFQDLDIPLEVVVCGVRTGYQIDAEEYAREAPDSITPLSIRHNLRLFFSALRQLSRNPRFLTDVVFGQGALADNFPVVEALGFSCAVPGLLHYDIFHDDPATIEPLESVFERQDLLRLCDGGVINNVASDTAWDSVYRGKIGSRNTFIAAFDVFAPVPRSHNVLWLPIQRIVRPTVLAKRPYSDFHKTFRGPPSPLNILVNSYSEMREILERAQQELADDRTFLERALEEIPPYGIWDIDRDQSSPAREV